MENDFSDFWMLHAKDCLPILLARPHILRAKAHMMWQNQIKHLPSFPCFMPSSYERQSILSAEKWGQQARLLNPLPSA